MRYLTNHPIYAVCIVLTVSIMAILVLGPTVGSVMMRSEQVRAQSQSTPSDDSDIVTLDNDEASYGVRMAGDTNSPISSLTPYPATPGVVVLEPVDAPSDTPSDGFARGIGDWLNVNVGGRPGFGRSPSLKETQRAAFELDKPDLRLTASEGEQLHGMVGATCIAVGTLKGTAQSRTLSYQLYLLNPLRKLGDPIAISGTDITLTQQLPELGDKLARGIDPSAAVQQSTIRLTPSDVMFLGDTAWLPAWSKEMKPFAGRLCSLGPKDPLAALLCFALQPFETTQEQYQLAGKEFSQTPVNAIVVEEIAEKSDIIQEYSDALTADSLQYPNNYLLAYSQSILYGAEGDTKSERSAANRMVQISPESARAWFVVGNVISDQADKVRASRYFSDMSPIEQTYVSDFYSSQEAYALQSTKLDPLDGGAWTKLSSAAEFNSDDSVAVPAIWKAIKYCIHKEEAYTWGLEMFQSKWVGDQASLDKVAALAKNGTFDTFDATHDVANELHWAGYDDDAAHVTQSLLNKVQSYIKIYPKSAEAYEELSNLLSYNGKSSEAFKAQEEACRLDPQSSSKLDSLAGYYYDRNDYSNAEATEAKAFTLDPRDDGAAVGMGDDFIQLGDPVRALQYLQLAVHINPCDKEAEQGLGYQYAQDGRYAEAIALFTRAFNQDSTSYYDTEMLVNLLDTTGKYKESIYYGHLALAQKSDDPMVLTDIEDDYLQLHQPEDCIRVSQFAIHTGVANSAAHENMAESYLQLGKIQKARQEWEVVIHTSSPGDPVYRAAQSYLAKYPDQPGGTQTAY